MRLKLKCDILLSTSALGFTLRRYGEDIIAAACQTSAARTHPTNPAAPVYTRRSTSSSSSNIAAESGASILSASSGA
jgi:hypothetical protein